MNSQIIERNKFAILYLVILSAHLLVFMPLFYRFGYRWDEILDFSGAATDTYIANGRWMQAGLRYILGEGVHPWTSPFLACIILSRTIVMQCKIFDWGSFYRNVAYGLLVVIMHQYAFVLQYAHQSDTIAIGMLLATLAVRELSFNSRSMSTVIACIYMCLAIATYQSLALYIIGLLLILSIRKCAYGDNKNVFRIALKSAAALICASIMWKIGKSCSLMFINDETRMCYEHAQSCMSNSAGIMESPVGYVCHYTLLVLKRAFHPEYKLEVLYPLTLIGVAAIAMASLRLHVDKCSKGIILVCTLGLWLLPFSMILALGNEWPCKPHTLLAEPIAFSGIWSIAADMYANQIKNKPKCKAILLSVLLILLVRASSSVSDIAKEERTLFERRAYNVNEMIREADILVQNSKEANRNLKYVYFNEETEYEYGSEDFTSSYPAWAKMRTARKADYDKHKTVVDHMPCWPREGSIRQNKGEIIIKGKNFGGTQEMNYM